MVDNRRRRRRPAAAALSLLAALPGGAARLGANPEAAREAAREASPPRRAEGSSHEEEAVDGAAVDEGSSREARDEIDAAARPRQRRDQYSWPPPLPGLNNGNSHIPANWPPPLPGLNVHQPAQPVARYGAQNWNNGGWNNGGWNNGGWNGNNNNNYCAPPFGGGGGGWSGANNGWNNGAYSTGGGGYYANGHWVGGTNHGTSGYGANYGAGYNTHGTSGYGGGYGPGVGGGYGPGSIVSYNGGNYECKPKRRGGNCNAAGNAPGHGDWSATWEWTSTCTDAPAGYWDNQGMQLNAAPAVEYVPPPPVQVNTAPYPPEPVVEYQYVVVEAPTAQRAPPAPRPQPKPLPRPAPRPVPRPARTSNNDKGCDRYPYYNSKDYYVRNDVVVSDGSKYKCLDERKCNESKNAPRLNNDRSSFVWRWEGYCDRRHDDRYDDRYDGGSGREGGRPVPRNDGPVRGIKGPRPDADKGPNGPRPQSASGNRPGNDNRPNNNNNRPNTNNNSDCPGIPPWRPNGNYRNGDIVSHLGERYECLEADYCDMGKFEPHREEGWELVWRAGGRCDGRGGGRGGGGGGGGDGNKGGGAGGGGGGGRGGGRDNDKFLGRGEDRYDMRPNGGGGNSGGSNNGRDDGRGSGNGGRGSGGGGSLCGRNGVPCGKDANGNNGEGGRYGNGGSNGGGLRGQGGGGGNRGQGSSNNGGRGQGNSNRGQGKNNSGGRGQGGGNRGQGKNRPNRGQNNRYDDYAYGSRYEYDEGRNGGRNGGRNNYNSNNGGRGPTTTNRPGGVNVMGYVSGSQNDNRPEGMEQYSAGGKYPWLDNDGDIYVDVDDDERARD